jgi:hypothetical protein
VPDAAVLEQVAALPDQVLADYTQVLDLLQVVPSSIPRLDGINLSLQPMAGPGAAWLRPHRA